MVVLLPGWPMCEDLVGLENTPPNGFGPWARAAAAKTSNVVLVELRTTPSNFAERSEIRLSNVLARQPL